MYLLLVLLILVIYTEQQVKDRVYLQKMKIIEEGCAKEEAVDWNDINKAWDENRFPDDQKYKCYYKCVHTKLGMIDATGDVLDDALKLAASQMNDAATRDEIVKECGALKGADLCDTAYKLEACIKAAKLD